MKVFLGGTCGNSNWRTYVIENLKLNYFNPVVKDWTPECQEEEIKQRQECDFVLYVITPLMSGVYSIAEVVEDSIKRPEKTIFCVLPRDYDGDVLVEFSSHQLKSLMTVGSMVSKNGAMVFDDLDSVVSYLNTKL